MSETCSIAVSKGDKPAKAKSKLSFIMERGMEGWSDPLGFEKVLERVKIEQDRYPAWVGTVDSSKDWWMSERMSEEDLVAEPDLDLILSSGFNLGTPGAVGID